MLANCYYKWGQYQKIIDRMEKMGDAPQESNNDIMVSSSFINDHQEYYLAGKSCDKVKDYKNATVYYKKAVQIMEETEKLNVDYKPLKLA